MIVRLHDKDVGRKRSSKFYIYFIYLFFDR